MRLRVECTLFCYLQTRARTHVVLVIGLYELLRNPSTWLIESPGAYICMRQHRNGNGTRFQNKDRSMILFEHFKNIQMIGMVVNNATVVHASINHCCPCSKIVIVLKSVLFYIQFMCVCLKPVHFFSFLFLYDGLPFFFILDDFSFFSLC